MPSVVFYDPKPEKVESHPIEGKPFVAVNLREGFRFGFVFEDLETLDEIVRTFAEARDELVALKAAEDLVAIAAAQVEYGDLLVRDGKATRIGGSTIRAGRTDLCDTYGRFIASYPSEHTVFVLRAEQEAQVA